MGTNTIPLGNEYRFSKIDIIDEGATTNIEFFYRDLSLPGKWRPRLRLWKIFYADMDKIKGLLTQENIRNTGSHYGPKVEGFSYKKIPVVETETAAVEMSGEVRKAYPDVKVEMHEIVYDDPEGYEEAEKKAPLIVGVNLKKEDFQILERKVSSEKAGSWPAYFASVVERLAQPMKVGYKIQ